MASALGRYQVAKPWLGSATSVLDVGPGPRGLGVVRAEPFVGLDVAFDGPPVAPMIALEYGGRTMPFQDAAFYTVLALDVLDALPPTARGAFLQELARVASTGVFVTFPAGEPGQARDDTWRALLAALGEPPPDWLRRHEAHGLPDVATVEAQLAALPGWRWEVVPSLGGLPGMMLDLADLLPSMDRWLGPVLAGDRAGLEAWIAAGDLGPPARQVYWLAREAPVPARVDFAVPGSLATALACPACRAGLGASAGGTLACRGCGATYGPDARGVTGLRAPDEVPAASEFAAVAGPRPAPATAPPAAPTKNALKRWLVAGVRAVPGGERVVGKLRTMLHPPTAAAPAPAQLNWLARYLPARPYMTPASFRSLLEVGSGYRGVGVIADAPFVGLEIVFAEPPVPPMRGIAYGGGRMPFKDAAFHTILSMDTYEHVPSPKRPGFLRELVRVAADTVLIGFPAGVEGRDQDAACQMLFPRLGLNTPGWLYEHAEHGIPDIAEVEAMLDALPGWRWRALPTTGSFANMLLVLADILPGMARWTGPAVRGDPAALARFITAGAFGPPARQVYLLTREDARPGLVDLAVPGSLEAALACPACQGDLAGDAKALACRACGARFGPDDRGVTVLTAPAAAPR